VIVRSWDMCLVRGRTGALEKIFNKFRYKAVTLFSNSTEICATYMNIHRIRLFISVIVKR
jgi:hypothetical protein